MQEKLEKSTKKLREREREREREKERERDINFFFFFFVRENKAQNRRDSNKFIVKWCE